MLQISQLHFERDDEPLLTDINFTVDAGQLIQIVGANGSGKTTLLRILCGLLSPTSGEIYWRGILRDTCSQQFLSELLFLSHQPAVKDGLTVLENIFFFSSIATNQNIFDAKNIIHQLGLAGYEYKLAKNLSAGQKRRLGLARLFLSNAKLWIFDEPFTALDCGGVQLIEKILAEFLLKGGMVILTSHQLFELKNIIPEKIFL